MDIRGYQPTSLIEWPGKIAAVVFTQGCNFRCPFCHNKDLVVLKGGKMKRLDEEAILGDLKKRLRWVDGVAITGGEPALQADLAAFLKKIKKTGLKTMLETNGSRPEVLKKLVTKRLVDFVAMDYKTEFENYKNLVLGRGDSRTLAKQIRESMQLILRSNLPYEFRTTVVPTIHNQQVLVQMAQELKELAVDTWILQFFRPKNCLDPKFETLKSFSDEEMGSFLKAVQALVPRARIR